jgi:hypothetical protein
MKQMLHISNLDATIDLTTPNGSTGAALLRWGMIFSENRDTLFGIMLAGKLTWTPARDA